MRRHNMGVNVLADWATNWCDCVVFKEQVVPNAHDEHTETRLDLIVHSPQVAGPMYVDFTVVSALSVEALSKGSALREGVAAGIAAAKKVAKYPGCATYPFPVEEHGRLGEASLTFVKMIAPTSKQLRSKAISALYHDLGSSLQRASAESLLAAVA